MLNHTCGFLSMAYVSSMMLEMRNVHAISSRKGKLAVKSQSQIACKIQEIFDLRHQGTTKDVLAVNLTAANQVSLSAMSPMKKACNTLVFKKCLTRLHAKYPVQCSVT